MTRPIEMIVADLVSPYLDEHGFELVEVQYVKEKGQYYLRLFVDKDGGIDLDDCERISEYVSGKLDEADPIPNAYFLEVSSPGAERPLKTPRDMMRAVGKHVLIKTLVPVDGQQTFEGTLVSYNETETVVAAGKKTHVIANEYIASARLAVLL